MKSLLDYDLFPSAGFTDTNTYIFFNDVLVDEIVGLKYDMIENTKPIYGYASYTADAIAKGNRIVNGTFTINFVENNYLYKVMDLISQNTVTKEDIDYAVNTNLTGETISHALKNGYTLEKLKLQIDYAKDVVWGKQSSNPISYYTSYFNNKAGKNGFDIVISYGDEKFHSKSLRDTIPHTTTILNNVHLTGVSQTIQANGGVLMEEYSFVGVDLNNILLSKK